MIMAFLLMLVCLPANTIHAASKIEITKTSQTMKVVKLYWKSVKGTSSYIITRKAADGKTGKIIQKSEKKWKTGTNAFNDTYLSNADNGKTFRYHISAVDKKGTEIASCTTYIMKTPTCAITDINVASEAKATLKWRKYDYIESYRFEWIEGTDFNSAKSIKTRTVDKTKSSVTITGLTPGKTYTFRVRGTGVGSYESKTVKSTGWYGKKSGALPIMRTSLVLHYNDGSVFRKYSLKKDESVILPSMKNPKGYTFIGWGPKKGMTVSGDRPYQVPFLAYQKLSNIQKETHLYAVLFDRSKEKDLSEKQMFAPDVSKYKKVIFVGDSRMERTELQLIRKFPDYKKKRIAFVSKGGAGISWLKTTGYSLLLDEIARTDQEDNRPIAVVFCLGVNGIERRGPESEGHAFLDFYRIIAPELKEQGCRLFNMSVNPLVSGQILSVRPGSLRKEWHVRVINAMMRSGLSDTYEYIDTYNWLLETGFSTNAGKATESVEDDGLHYSFRTYKRIIWKALQYLATH